MTDTPDDPAPPFRIEKPGDPNDDAWDIHLARHTLQEVSDAFPQMPPEFRYHLMLALLPERMKSKQSEGFSKVMVRIMAALLPVLQEEGMALDLIGGKK